MSNFKVGDKVVRSSMNLEFVPSAYIGIYKEGVPLTIKKIENEYLQFKEINFNWLSCDFKLYEDTSKYHMHHDQIVAWAKGATVEILNYDGKWQTIKDDVIPYWTTTEQYRIKPTEKSDQQQKIDHIESEMRKLADQLNELKGS